MENNMPLTPKSKLKVKRLGSTPDRGNALSSNPAIIRHVARHRSVATVHDVSLNISSASTVKKKFGGSRLSMMPSSLSSSFGSDKHEADNTETELGLLYNNYLQTLMANVLLKKKAIENENKILNQLGSISKEQDLGNEKLSKMKRRKKDVRYLTTLQNTLDSLITEIRSNIEDLESQSVNEKLATLKTHLEPFDFLRCQGIDLPNTPEEKQKFEVTLKQCCKCLQEVSELLKEKSGNLQKVKSELKESIEAFKQIDGLQKNICTTMNNLQNLVLKTASQSLSETLS